MTSFKKDNVIFTHNAVFKMNHFHLSETDVLTTLMHPQKSKKITLGYNTIVKQNTYDFGAYTVTLMYKWNDTQKVYILITCWSNANKEDRIYK
jgi:hypothetical protein